MEEKMAGRKRRKEEESEWKKKSSKGEYKKKQVKWKKNRKIIFKTTCIERKMCKMVAHQWKRTTVKRFWMIKERMYETEVNEEWQKVFKKETMQ